LANSVRWNADLSLVMCTLIWGATFVVVKGALDHASVFVFLAARFVVAVLLMAAIFRRDLRRVTRVEVLAGVQIGFFMFSGYVFQTAGLLHTTPSKAAFITGFSVVLVPILMGLLWRRRINLWVWSGALAALAGLYYLAVPAAGFGGLGRGDLLVAGCTVMFALHIVFVGHYTARHRVGALSFIQVATTAALTLAALPVLSATGWELPHMDWSPEFIGGVLITGILATAVCFSVQVWAQKFTTATHTAIIFTLEPVFAAVTSYLLMNERLGPRGLLGAGMILAGILLAELKGPAQAAPESPGPVGGVSASHE
jgi:drug/metabolite transporter (DMT)-like permease